MVKGYLGGFNEIQRYGDHGGREERYFLEKKLISIF